MVLLRNYFSQAVRFNGKEIIFNLKNYKNEDNHISCEIGKFKVNINLRENSMLVKCSCGEYDCQHLYATLLYLERLKYQDSIKNLNKIYKHRLKLLNEAIKIKTNRTTYLNSKDITEYYTALDSEKYINYLNELFEHDLDTYINIEGLGEFNTLKEEIQTFISFDLQNLFKLKEYDTIFKLLKIIIEYFIKIESTNEKFLKAYVDLLKNNIQKLINKTKKHEIRYEIFDWLLKTSLYPEYNDLITYIRNLTLNKYNKTEYLYEKEELSLIAFNNAENTYYEILEKDDGYIEIQRKLKTDYLNDKKFWFKYHLSVLKKLNYTEFEILEFIKHTQEYSESKIYLLNTYKKENNNQKIINTLKSIIQDSKIEINTRKKYINELEEYDKNYINTEEYLNLLEKIIFEEKIIDLKLTSDYINKKEKINNFEELLEIVEDSNNSKVLNRLYYLNKDKQKLLKNILKEKPINELYKYEDFLIDEYEEKLLKILTEYLIKVPEKSFKKNFPLIKEGFQHLKKYSNSRKESNNIIKFYKRNYYGVGNYIKELNKTIEKEYKKTKLDDFF